MGLFDIFKFSGSNPDSEKIYNTQINFDRVFDEGIDISEKTDLDSVLDNYTKFEEVSTKISGSNIIEDISSAAISFAKSYFAFKNDGIELVKKERNEIRVQMDRLYKLSLDRTDNYKRLKKRFDIANEIINQNLIIEKRVEFSDELLRLVPSVMIVSFKDFETIINKYEYTKLTILSELCGEVTDHNIKVLTDLSECGGKYSLLIDNIGYWIEDGEIMTRDGSDILSGRVNYAVRLSVIRSVGKTEDDNITFPTPFLLAIKKCGYKNHDYDYFHPEYEYEDTHFRLWNKNGDMVSKCPIFGKIPNDPLINSAIEESLKSRSSLSLFGEVIAYNSAALAISPEHPEHFPIVFQIFNKGVLIYDLIGCQDYSSFPNMSKYYEDKSKKHK